MAVVSVAELPDSPTGNLGQDTSSFERKFLVTVNAYSDGPITAMNAIGVPPLFSTYLFNSEGHLFARVRNITAERAAPNALHWVVTCEYETPDDEEDEDEETNPLAELPEIKVSFEQVEEIVPGELESQGKGTWSKGAANSAGEVFDPPSTRQVANMILTISRNESIAANHPALGAQFLNTLNENAYFGQPARTWRMTGYTVDRQVKRFQDGTELAYLKVQWTAHNREEGWDIALLDHGSYYLENGEKVAFKTEDGERYKGLLNGDDGGKSETPEYLDPLKVYVDKDWAALALPNSFAEGK